MLCGILFYIWENIKSHFLIYNLRSLYVKIINEKVFARYNKRKHALFL